MGISSFLIPAVHSLQLSSTTTQAHQRPSVLEYSLPTAEAIVITTSPMPWDRVPGIFPKCLSYICLVAESVLVNISITLSFFYCM